MHVLWGCLPFVLGVVVNVNVNVNAFAECLFGWLSLVVLFSSTKMMLMLVLFHNIIVVIICHCDYHCLLTPFVATCTTGC